jgi:hypothetical protein
MPGIAAGGCSRNRRDVYDILIESRRGTIYRAPSVLMGNFGEGSHGFNFGAMIRSICAGVYWDMPLHAQACH